MKEGAVFSEGVNRWRFRNRITIASQGGGLVISDKEDNIFLDREEKWREDEWKRNTKCQEFYHRLKIIEKFRREVKPSELIG